ncbi:MAG: carbohydrate-binding protein [Chitinispirillia bacterium]|nr:carbohydrate-binding protein [Chitinispirillia bacterium]MCL2241258.1 carbohydrate-binding protein [Chitinispirillia bacterium]
MKNTFVAVALTTVFLAGAVSAQTAGWLSSYWDGCKPTCSWYQNLSEDPKFLKYGLSRSCNIKNEELPLGEIAEAKCAKEGGPAYSCWNQIPFVDKGVAYGFGATATAVCGQCFEVTFTGEYENGPAMPMHKALAGKKAIIMGRNTGGVGNNQIDFLIPGGGLGDFDCFSEQIGLPANSDKLGKRFGGLLGSCIDGAIAQFGGNWNAAGVLEWVQNCHRTGCNTAFGNFPDLLEGCLFHVDWMMSAPNPKATVKALDECPQILVDGYVPKSSKYTLLRKFMYFTSSTGSPNVNPGNKSVGGVNSGVTLTYNDLNALTAGPYTLSVAIATSEKTIISVTVNGQPVITSSDVSTGNWSPFTVVVLGEVDLKAGNNTIVFGFQTNSVNIDYFLLAGQPSDPPPQQVPATLEISTSPDAGVTSAFITDTLVIDRTAPPTIYAHVFGQSGNIIGNIDCETIKWTRVALTQDIPSWTGCSFAFPSSANAFSVTAAYTANPQVSKTIAIADDNVSVRHRASSMAKNGYSITVRPNAVLFAVPEGRSITKVSVHDLRGRRVFSRTGGDPMVTWNSSRQSKGMYVVRMVMDNGVAVQRNLMLK